MNRLFVASVSFAVLTIASASVFADGKNTKRPPRHVFRVVYMSDVMSRGEKARISAMATKSAVAEIQREIQADPSLSSKLFARGIPVRQIIGRSRAMNGAIIYYVR